MRNPDFFQHFMNAMVLGGQQSLGLWIMAISGTVLVYWTVERVQAVKRLPSLSRLIFYGLLFYALYKLGHYIPRKLW